MTCNSNEFYGHGHVLRTYAGLPMGPLRGRVQHGWTPGPIAVLDELTVRGEPYFVWTERDALGLRRGCTTSNPIMIGAPYLYTESPAVHPSRSGVVAFPHHSLNHRVLKDTGRWRAYAQDFRHWAKAEGLMPAVACLHIRDFERGDVIRAFEYAGVEVTTCGDAMNPFFLKRFDDVLLKFAAATSNRVSTAIFYALFMGLPCIVRGDPMLCEPPDVLEEETSSHEWRVKHYPELTVLAENQLLAARQLGRHNMKKPMELSALLEVLD